MGILYSSAQSLLKSVRNSLQKKRLTNKDFSIISNHCLSGFIYHDLSLPFLSPTINLKIIPEHFITIVEDLEYYMSQNIEQVFVDGSNYPIAQIPVKDSPGDAVQIHFLHYSSFDIAREKWEKRAERINWDNIVIIMSVRDGCDNSVLERFERLPFKRVCFTLEDYPEHPHTRWARLDNGKPLGGNIGAMVNILGKRGYECCGFDLIDFLNK